MNKQQTDNDSIGFGYKVSLRIETAKDNQRVLDCYHGHGFIWNAVTKETGHSINITPIDIRLDKSSAYLKGNNIKYLMSMDLNRYDVIDLDAYGIPFEQLEVLFQNNYRGIVHVTFIQSGMGRINNKMLNELGYTQSMIRKVPTLFSKNGYDKFLNYLSIRNVLTINELSYGRKHYLYFKLNES